MANHHTVIYESSIVCFWFKILKTDCYEQTITTDWFFVSNLLFFMFLGLCGQLSSANLEVIWTIMTNFLMLNFSSFHVSLPYIPKFTWLTTIKLFLDCWRFSRWILRYEAFFFQLFLTSLLNEVIISAIMVH